MLCSGERTLQGTFQAYSAESSNSRKVIICPIAVSRGRAQRREDVRPTFDGEPESAGDENQGMKELERRCRWPKASSSGGAAALARDAADHELRRGCCYLNGWPLCWPLLMAD